MIISVPNSLNFSHRSLVSSLHLTPTSESEHMAGLGVLNGEKALESLGEMHSSRTESVSRTESESESLTVNENKKY